MIKPVCRWRGVATLTLAFFLCVGFGVRSAIAQVGSPTLLPSGGFSPITASGINDVGQIVGDGTVSGVTSPVFWPSRTTNPETLVIAGFGSPISARGINNGGHIVGVSGSGSGQLPLYWATHASTPVALSTGGFGGVAATGINNAGQIVGSAGLLLKVSLYWPSPTSTPIPLSAGAFTRELAAIGINDAGQIVGYGDSNGSRVAILWASPTSTPIQIPSSGGPGIPAWIAAYGINGAGQIVGFEHDNQQAKYWANQASPPLNLPDGTFYPGLEGHGINSIGEIVGIGTSPQLTPIALIWALQPICDVELSKSAYSTGDTVTIPVFRLANPNIVSASIEIKVWFAIPGGSALSFVNAGTDGSVVLPSGFNANLGPIPFFTVTASSPRGNYQFSCRMLDPTTGLTLRTTLNPFLIQ